MYRRRRRVPGGGPSGLDVPLTNGTFVRRPCNKREADEVMFVCRIVTSVDRSIRATVVSANVCANRPHWIIHPSWRARLLTWPKARGKEL